MEVDLIRQQQERENIVEIKILKNGEFAGGEIFIKLRDLAFDAGDYITGVVYVNLNKPFKASDLVINLKGFEYTKFQVNRYEHRG
mgnify:CR=1 FL=1